MTRILVVDDHPAVRRGVKQLLADEFGTVTWGEAASAREALAMVQGQEWDLVLLDLSLPDQNGLEVLKRLRRARPTLPVLMLSMHPAEQFAPWALRAGAAGYVTKGRAAEELGPAIRAVLAGRSSVEVASGGAAAVSLDSR